MQLFLKHSELLGTPAAPTFPACALWSTNNLVYVIQETEMLIYNK